MKTKYLRINPADNVAVAIVNLPAGEHLSVDDIEITLNEDIPAGHKFALKNFTLTTRFRFLWIFLIKILHSKVIVAKTVM